MPFQFKQFLVEQNQCAMKIGTDAVLLGAWTPLNNNPYSVLDIGTGTGIISLILAQRSAAEQIDAVEIEENAYEQAVNNFENSPWNNRLFCFHADVRELINEPEDEYDLIVSNPPFYTEQFPSENEKRQLARSASELPFEILIEAVVLLLSDNGIFSVIIPFKEEEHFIALAKNKNLFPSKITRVKGNPNAEIKRSLLAFSRTFEKKIEINELIIETSRHKYTPDYINLTKNFYLKM